MVKGIVFVADELELRLLNVAVEQKIIPSDVLGYTKVITGAGALNVIETLNNMDLDPDVPIVNVGYASSKNIPAGKFYRVNEVSLYHPGVEYPEPYYKIASKYGGVDCYTGTDFVEEVELKDCVYDTELAYIAAFGFTNIEAYKYVGEPEDNKE